MKHLRASAGLAVLVFASPSAAQDPFTELDAALTARAARGEFAGVVAVARAGEMLHVIALGKANVEFGVPHDAMTRFKLHSLSKPLLAAAVLRSVDAGKLELDGLVGEHLPEWPLPWSEVTVRHLLNHTSGIPDLAESFLSDWAGSARATWLALAPQLRSRELAAEPGARWSYSNAGYVLLAALLEEVWDRPVARVLAEQVFEPAGLRATELETTPPWSGIAYDGHRVLERLASGYNGTPAALQVASSKMYAIPGAGGIVSDAADLVAFAHALFAGDLLEPETRAALTRVPQGQSVHYALGWVVKERDGHVVYAHDGGNNGFVSSLEHDPGSGLTIVILSNLGFAPMGELRDEVARLSRAATD